MKNNCAECDTNKGKMTICTRCKNTYCLKDIYFYIDGNSGAITRNSRPYCRQCYKTVYPGFYS